MAENTNPLHVVTQPVRLSYVHVLTPKARTNDDGSPAEPEYSCMLMIPKTDVVTLNAIKAAQRAALAAGAAKGTFGGTAAPKAWKNTLRDGDAESDDPELEGHMFINVSSKSKPGVVDMHVRPILDSTEVYSGMWARIDMAAFAYNQRGNRGVSFGLNHVQKIRDDERLDGSTRAEDVFEPWVEDGEESLI